MKLKVAEKEKKPQLYALVVTSIQIQRGFFGCNCSAVHYACCSYAKYKKSGLEL